MLRWEAFQARVYITHSPTYTFILIPVLVVGLMRLVLDPINEYDIAGISRTIRGYEYSLRSIDDKRSQAETLAIASLQDESDVPIPVLIYSYSYLILIYPYSTYLYTQV